MTPLLAAYADKVIIHALKLLVPVAVIAVAFGVVYWLIRRRTERREAEKRRKWLEDRRAQREGGAKAEGDDAASR